MRATIPVLTLLFTTVLQSNAQTIHFEQKTGYSTFAVREPVLRMKPGDTVEANSRPLVGPIYIEGATTNDTLVIRILKLRPNLETGTSGTSPSFLWSACSNDKYADVERTSARDSANVEDRH